MIALKKRISVLIVKKLSLIVLKLQERVWREECWWLKTLPRIGQQSFQGWKRHRGPQTLQWGSRGGTSFKRYNLRQKIGLEEKQISIIYFRPLGPELALALANRSAAHVRLANWGQALTDIDMALSAKFAHPNPAKLMERKVKCQQMLGKAISIISFLRHILARYEVREPFHTSFNIQMNKSNPYHRRFLQVCVIALAHVAQ